MRSPLGGEPEFFSLLDEHDRPRRGHARFYLWIHMLQMQMQVVIVILSYASGLSSSGGYLPSTSEAS